MRDDAVQKLYNLVSTIDVPQPLKFNTLGRRLQLWGDVPDQPAFFLKMKQQAQTQRELGLRKLDIACQAWIYFRAEGNTSDQQYPGETIVNMYLDAIDQALQPLPGETQTLGGTCYNCFIDGQVLFDDGASGDNQGVLVVPITIRIGG